MSVWTSGDRVDSRTAAFQSGVSQVTNWGNRDLIMVSQWRGADVEKISSSGWSFYNDEISVVSHRGHYPLDGGRRQLLSFGLLDHRDPQVLELEHHALQKGLPRVRPVLWQLCRWEIHPVTRLITDNTRRLLWWGQSPWPIVFRKAQVTHVLP